MSNDYLSVTVLTGYIKNIIDSEELLHNIKLVGEVSGIRCSGPHAYFDLKDQNAQIACCCFGYARTYLPKSGESVVLNGSLDFYQKGGKITFIAKTIQPLGKGLLALQLEELKAKLLKAGYFDESHKKDIPRFPEKVCVITAKTGAVIRDIVSTVRKRNQLLNIDVIDVKVQGENSANSIINALDFADKLGYDAIIIARGGGSQEDLMPFNDEKLVYKIYDAVTPIISAVGHETDFTLCDFVADKRVPTPTAAGQLVGYDVAELKANVIKMTDRYLVAMRDKLDRSTVQLAQSVRQLVSGNNIAYTVNKAKVESLSQSMIYAIDSKLNTSENAVKQLVAKLDANNPTRILSQGYARVYDESGHHADIESVVKGDNITVLMTGGRVSAVVDEVKREKEGI